MVSSPFVFRQEPVSVEKITRKETRARISARGIFSKNKLLSGFSGA